MIINPNVSGGTMSTSIGTFRLRNTPNSFYSIYNGDASDNRISFVIGMTWAEYIEQINAGGFFVNTSGLVEIYISSAGTFLWLDGVNTNDKIIDGGEYAIMFN